MPLQIALSLFLLLPMASGPRTVSPPNIVLILADDLGYGEIGAFGQQRIRTPNLDRLACQGARLTNHYSGSAVCAPARCTLMLGKHTGHATVRNNKEVGGWGPDEPEGQHPIPDEDRTIAEVLKERGYATAAIGKWGLGGPGSSGQPNRQGFDLFFGYLCQRVAHNYYPTHLWRNDQRQDLRGNEWFSAHQRFPEDDVPRDEAAYKRYSTSVYAPDPMIEAAEGFIDAHAHEPFFLYYPSLIPHLALQVPETYVDAYPRSWDEAAYLGDHGYLPHPRPRAAYAAMITRLDEEVGRLLARLDAHGIADNTIVIFTSDNGPSWVGGVDRDFFASSGPLRGRKAQLYEGGIRVPTIVRWPHHVVPGSTCEAISALWDWYPTLAAIAGADEVGCDGIDLGPALRGGELAVNRGLYWEFGQWQALRRGPWKLLRRKDRNGAQAMLFNLEEDPGEARDLAAVLPELVDQMIHDAAAHRVPSPVFASFLDAMEEMP